MEGGTTERAAVNLDMVLEMEVGDSLEKVKGGEGGGGCWHWDPQGP